MTELIDQMNFKVKPKSDKAQILVLLLYNHRKYFNADGLSFKLVGTQRLHLDALIERFLGVRVN